MSPTARNDQAGFTLVELLITITIQALILGALGMAFIGILNGHKNVNESLSRSGDARIAANYIIADARNSSGPEISLNDTASCPDASPPVAGSATPVVRFNWDSTSSSGASTPNIVNYVLVNNSLLRRVCVNGSLTSDRVVAATVASTTVACSPTANCTNSPTTINVTVTEVADSTGAVYQYSLKGAFRKLNGTGPPVATGAPQSLILLGAGTCSTGATGLYASDSGIITVYGNAYVNTANGSSCNAMRLTHSSDFAAGKIWMLQGGTCSASTGSVCPSLASYTPAIADPYAALAAPSTSGLPSRTGCSGSSGSQTAQPGMYAGGFSLAAGKTCTLASGIYVVQNGFDIAGGAVLQSGAGGVLIYLMSGQLSIAGGSAVTLTAMTSGTYSGLVVWQVAANTSTISLTDAGALAFNGALYGPNATLDLSGNEQAPTVSSVVVESIVMANSGGGGEGGDGDGDNDGIGVSGITIGAPLAITAPVSLPTGEVSIAYPSTPASGTGGGGAYVWSASGLPAGMSINSATGTISGTPTVTKSGSITITLNDAAGDAADSQTLALTVKAAPNITTASPIAAATVNKAYSKTLAVSGGTSPFTWSATGLPAGLSISSGGVISGTPTATGTSTITATVTDALGVTDSQGLSITVNPVPSITTASALPKGEKTVAYSTTIAGTAGSTPYTWAASGLPAGLSIASGTGVISGAPTASGSFTPSVTLTDAAGAADSNSFTLTIDPQPSISSVVLANKTGGTSGTIEQGDTITITFSTTMNVNSFCSTWSNNANNQSLSADNDVTVSVSNANPDVLTVTSGTCAFNFGSINLANNSYTSAAATFKGSGANKSTIAWTAAQNKLVITLGAKTAGTVANVSSSAPSYNASGSIEDAQTANLGPGSFTISPAAKQF